MSNERILTPAELKLLQEKKLFLDKNSAPTVHGEAGEEVPLNLGNDIRNSFKEFASDTENAAPFYNTGHAFAEHGASKFDDGTPYNATTSPMGIPNWRGEVQPVADKLFNGLLVRLPLTTVTKLMEGVGYIPGAIAWAATGDITQMTENGWSQEWNKVEEGIKDWAAIYAPEHVREGNLGNKLMSASFWMDEAVDAFAFFAGFAALGYALGPGMAPVYRAMSASKNIQRAIGLTTATVAQTTSEAGFEAAHFGKEFNHKIEAELGKLSQELQDAGVPPEIAQQKLAEREQELQASKTQAQAEIFRTNVALLAGPNIIMNKFLFGKFFNGKSNVVRRIYDESSNFRDAAKMLGRKDIAGRIAQNVGTGIVSEGFWEEGLQETTTRYYEDLLLDKTDSPYFKGLAETYMESLGDTNFQTAIFLGSLLGAIGGGVGGYKSSIADNKRIAALHDARLKNKHSARSTLHGSIMSENGEYAGKDPKVLKDKLEYISEVIGKDASHDLFVGADKTDVAELLSDHALIDWAYDLLQEEGGVEILKEQLDNMTEDSFKEYTDTQKGTFTKEDFTKHKQILKDKLDTFKKIVDRVDDRYSTYLSDVTNFTGLSEEQFRTAKSSFIGNMAFAQTNTLATINYFKTLSDSKIKAINTLLSENSLGPVSVSEMIDDKGKVSESAIKDAMDRIKAIPGIAAADIEVAERTFKDLKDSQELIEKFNEDFKLLTDKSLYQEYFNELSKDVQKYEKYKEEVKKKLEERKEAVEAGGGEAKVFAEEVLEDTYEIEQVEDPENPDKKLNILHRGKIALNIKNTEKNTVQTVEATVHGATKEDYIHVKVRPMKASGEVDKSGEAKDYYLTVTNGKMEIYSWKNGKYTPISSREIVPLTRDMVNEAGETETISLPYIVIESVEEVKQAYHEKIYSNAVAQVENKLYTAFATNQEALRIIQESLKRVDEFIGQAEKTKKNIGLRAKGENQLKRDELKKDIENILQISVKNVVTLQMLRDLKAKLTPMVDSLDVNVKETHGELVRILKSFSDPATRTEKEKSLEENINVLQKMVDHLKSVGKILSLRIKGLETWIKGLETKLGKFDAKRDETILERVIREEKEAEDAKKAGEFYQELTIEQRIARAEADMELLRDKIEKDIANGYNKLAEAENQLAGINNDLAQVLPFLESAEDEVKHRKEILEKYKEVLVNDIKGVIAGKKTNKTEQNLSSQEQEENAEVENDEADAVEAAKIPEMHIFHGFVDDLLVTTAQEENYKDAPQDYENDLKFQRLLDELNQDETDLKVKLVSKNTILNDERYSKFVTPARLKNIKDIAEEEAVFVVIVDENGEVYTEESLFEESKQLLLLSSTLTAKKVNGKWVNEKLHSTHHVVAVDSYYKAVEEQKDAPSFEDAFDTQYEKFNSQVKLVIKEKGESEALPITDITTGHLLDYEYNNAEDVFSSKEIDELDVVVGTGTTISRGGRNITKMRKGMAKVFYKNKLRNLKRSVLSTPDVKNIIGLLQVYMSGTMEDVVLDAINDFTFLYKDPVAKRDRKDFTFFIELDKEGKPLRVHFGKEGSIDTADLLEGTTEQLNALTTFLEGKVYNVIDEHTKDTGVFYSQEYSITDTSSGKVYGTNSREYESYNKFLFSGTEPRVKIQLPKTVSKMQALSNSPIVNRGLRYDFKLIEPKEKPANIVYKEGVAPETVEPATPSKGKPKAKPDTGEGLTPDHPEPSFDELKEAEPENKEDIISPEELENKKSEFDDIKLSNSNKKLVSPTRHAEKQTRAQHEMDLLRKMFPNANMYNDSNMSAEAVMKIRNGVVTVGFRSMGVEGRAYHEAFHIIEDVFLPVNEKAELYADTKKRLGNRKYTVEGVEVIGNQMTAHQISEFLAEEYRHYRLVGKDSYKFAENESILQKFFGWLDNIINKLAEFFGIKQRVNSEGLLMSKAEKLFRTWDGKQESIPSTVPVADTQKFRIGNLTSDESQALANFIDYSFFDIFNTDPDYKGMTYKDINGEILNSIYDKVTDKIKEKWGAFAKDRTHFIYKMSPKDDILPAYARHRKLIKDYGIDSMIEITEELTSQEVETPTQFIESLYVNVIDTAASEVKFFVAGLPKLMIVDGVTYIETNKGLETNAEFSNTFGMLHYHLANLPHYDAMVDKMQSLSTRFPIYKVILDRLGSDNSNYSKTKSDQAIGLRVAFFNQFRASNNDFVNALINRDQDLYFLNASETSAEKRIRQQWINNVKLGKSNAFKAQGSTKVLNLDATVRLGGIAKPLRAFLGGATFSAANFEKQFPFSRKLDAKKDLLALLGMITPENYGNLSSEKEVINKAIFHILDELNPRKGKEITVDDIYDSTQFKINDILIDLARGFAEYGGDYMTNSYVDKSGKHAYSLMLPSSLSDAVDVLNYYSGKRELPRLLAPFKAGQGNLGTINSQWAAHSESGKDIRIEVLRTYGEERGEQDNINEINPTDFVHAEMNSVLAGKFPFLRSAERGMENVFDLGPEYLGKFYRDYASTEKGRARLMRQYLVAEVAKALVHLNAAEYSQLTKNDNYKTLSFFETIVPTHFNTLLATQKVDKADALITAEELVRSHWIELEKSIISYLKAEEDSVRELLKHYDLMEERTVKGKPVIFFPSISKEITNRLMPRIIKEDTNLEELPPNVADHIVSVINISFIHGFMEQIKLFIGDPKQFTKRNSNELFKRTTLHAATKKFLMNTPSYIESANELIPRMDGTKHDHLKRTLPVEDIQETSAYFGLIDTLLRDASNKDRPETASQYKGIKSSDAGAAFTLDGTMRFMHSAGILGDKKQTLVYEQQFLYQWILNNKKHDLLKGKPAKMLKRFTKENYEKIFSKHLPDNYDSNKFYFEGKEVKYHELTPIEVFKPQMTSRILNPEVVDANVYASDKTGARTLIPTELIRTDGTYKQDFILLLNATLLGIDEIAPRTTNKHEEIGNDKGKLAELYGEDGIVNDFSKMFGKEFPVRLTDWSQTANQLDIDPFGKARVTHSVQMKKLFTIDMFSSGEIREGYKELKESVSRANTLISEMVERDMVNLFDELGLVRREEGTYTLEDKERFVESILNAIDRRDNPKLMSDSIAYVMEQSIKYFETLPTQRQIRNLIQGIIRNQVIKTKVNGDMLVLVPPTGQEIAPKQKNAAGEFVTSSEDLKYYRPVKEDGSEYTLEEINKMSQKDIKKVAPAQAKISIRKEWVPIMMKHLNKEGENITRQDLERFNKLIIDKTWTHYKFWKEVRTIIVNRTPAQHLNSIDILEVVEFLGIESGPKIVIAAELVAKTGADFDIDKITAYITNLLKSGEIDGMFDMNQSSAEKALYIYQNKEVLERMLRKYKDVASNRNAEIIKHVKEIGKLIWENMQSKTELKESEEYSTIYERIDQLNAAVNAAEDTDTKESFEIQLGMETLKLRDLMFNVDTELEFLNKEKNKIVALIEQSIVPHATQMDLTSRAGIENSLNRIINETILLPQNIHSLVRPNDPGIVKEAAKALDGDASEGVADISKMLTFKFNSEVAQNQWGPARLISITAIMMTAHPVLQQHKVSVSSDIFESFFPKLLGVEGDYTFGHFKDEEDNTISNTNGDTGTSAVDASKEVIPSISIIGYNTKTAYAYHMLNMLGKGENSSAGFRSLTKLFNHSIIKEINRKLSNSESDYNTYIARNYKEKGEIITDVLKGRGIRVHKDHIFLYERMSNYLKAETSEEMNDAKRRLTEGLNEFRKLNKPITKELIESSDPNDQLLVAEYYLYFIEAGKILKSLTDIIRPDTKLDKSTSGVELRNRSYNKLIQLGMFSKAELDKLMEDSYLGAYSKVHEHSYTSTKEFSAISDIPTLNSTMWDIAGLMETFTNRNLSKSQDALIKIHHKLSNGLVSYVLHTTTHPFWQKALRDFYSSYVTGEKTLTKDFAALQDKYGEDNIFLRITQAVVKEYIKRRGAARKVDYIKFNQAKFTSSEANRITEAIQDMANHSDPDMRHMAEMLSIQSIIQSGVQLSPVSFFEYMPVELYHKRIQTLLYTYKNIVSPKIGIDTRQAKRIIFNNYRTDKDLVPRAPSKFLVTHRKVGKILTLPVNSYYANFEYVSLEVNLGTINKPNMQIALFESTNRPMKSNKDLVAYRMLPIRGDGYAFFDATEIENETIPYPDNSRLSKALLSGSSAVDAIAGEEVKPNFDELPKYTLGQRTMTYAGIGSRTDTPANILEVMTKAAKYLEGLGYTLNTGVTFKNKEEGADAAFSKGTKKKNLFSPDVHGKRDKERAIAKEIHPAPERLTKTNPDGTVNDGALSLMARNTNQIFGDKLDTPVDFVLFYAEESSDSMRPKGGTGQAVEMARRKFIPTINMAEKGWRVKLEVILNAAKESGGARVDATSAWSTLKKQAVYTTKGINTMRTENKEAEHAHFGNPFSEAGYAGTIKVKSVAEAIQAYKDWLLGNNHKNVKPRQRKWILDQINSGKLDGATLLYDKTLADRGLGSHADALAEVINKLRNINKGEDMAQLDTGERLELSEMTADKALITALKDVWDTHNITASEVDNIMMDGEKINAVAKANVISRTIEYIEGKRSLETLPEETAHIMVALMRGTAIYKLMYKQIARTELYDTVLREYSEIYKGNERMLREEAIGKAIASAMVKENNNRINKTEATTFAQWLRGFLKAIKDFFTGASKSNPYAKVATRILDNNLNSLINKNLEKSERPSEPDMYSMRLGAQDDYLQSMRAQRKAQEELTQARGQRVSGIARLLKRAPIEMANSDRVQLEQSEADMLASEDRVIKTNETELNKVTKIPSNVGTQLEINFNSSDDILSGLNSSNTEVKVQTLDKVNQFIDSIKVPVEMVDFGDNITLAAANFTKGVIQIAEQIDKRPSAWNKLPEEAAHWWYRLLKENSSLKNELWNSHKTMLKANALYKTKYGEKVSKPEDLKEEAIGHLIAEAIHELENNNATPQQRSLWRAIVDFVKGIFNIPVQTTMAVQDPFTLAAQRILNSELSELLTLEEYLGLNAIVTEVIEVEKIPTKNSPIIENGNEYLDKLLDGRYKKKSKYLSKTIKKYIQNVGKSKLSKVSLRPDEITRMQADNNYETFAPSLKSYDILRDKFKKNLISLNSPIKLDGVKKEELGILNDIRTLILKENPSMRTINVEEFINEVSVFLGENYKLGFERVDSTFDKYRIDLTFAEDTSHRKIGIRFNDQKILGSQSHFDSSPVAWGNYTPFRDSVLIHEIQNDFFEIIQKMMKGGDIIGMDMSLLAFILKYDKSMHPIMNKANLGQEITIDDYNNFVKYYEHKLEEYKYARVDTGVDTAFKEIDYLQTAKNILSDVINKGKYKLVTKEDIARFKAAETYATSDMQSREEIKKELIDKFILELRKEYGISGYIQDNIGLILKSIPFFNEGFVNKSLSYDKSYYRLLSVKKIQLRQAFVMEKALNKAVEMSTLTKEEFMKLAEHVTHNIKLFLNMYKGENIEVGNELKGTFAIEQNYFTPLIHKVIQTAMTNHPGNKLYFPGYAITMLTQMQQPTSKSQTPTADLYAGPEDVKAGRASNIGVMWANMNKVAGIKLKYVENIPGFVQPVDGYEIDVSNYKLTSPILFGLDTQQSEKSETNSSEESVMSEQLRNFDRFYPAFADVLRTEEARRIFIQDVMDGKIEIIC